jgi:putative membrane protein
MNYLLSKWLHIVAVISWMAGILYLLRLFVYHQEKGHASADVHNLLSLMERRLLYYITHPAMGVSWIAGLAMIVQQPVLMRGGWLHSKLALVLLLTGVTIYAGRLHKRLARGESVLSGKALRFLNELPTILMIGIVGLVVLKPF